MGEIRYLSCKECGYEKEMHIGGGLMSINPSVVKKSLQGEDLEQWNSLQEKNEIKRFIWEYAMAFCEDCGELSEVFMVQVETKEGQDLILDCRCKKCQKKLEPIKKKIDIMCPACGQTILRNDLMGHWD